MNYTFKPTASKRIDVYDSEAGTEIRNALLALQESPAYITEEGFSADKMKYPDGAIPFVERHLLYLHQHPKVNPQHYLSNLRLQLKVR